MQNIKKNTNYKKNIYITLMILISILIYCLINKNKKINIVNKQITWNLNPSTEKEYNIALKQWENQCYFKKGNEYIGSEIKNKIGNNNKTLHCLRGNITRGSDGINGEQTREVNSELKYEYIKHYFSSDIMRFTNTIEFPIYFDDKWLIKFDTYCDTTPPPVKP
ncbi:hypothetical protein CWO85_02135 [Candidatus Phytoplasma ziziphi]|uniref:Uncharacterized protein n=1 Tax=Ziziphus jujuba witches'-broom phytoplasma TaxID=135727 RepID=A0A660HN56_ZIZJU|nr:hypothetical protein [Candidatus Phytoplasma ziziphi]AYJ01309.1 hypothetical protein CWO85_02135 [Candidatus Phytoplasma ziziphi]